MIAPLPPNETDRLAALRRHAILDTPAEPAFDRITKIAAAVFRMPIVTVTLLDETRQWFKSCVGLEIASTEREVAFCAHAILIDEVMIVPDARNDPRFLDNPLVTGAAHIRFYAGAPLKTSDGFILGTLCVIDTVPRTFLAADAKMLADFAAILTNELELRLAAVKLAAEVKERQRAESQIREQAALLDKAQDAILVRGLDDIIHFWNKSAEHLYGWTAQEAIGQDVSRLLYSDPVHFVEARRIVIEKGGWIGELLQRSKDGREITVEAHWTLVRDEQGAPQSVLAINTDITERNLLKAQLVRAQRMESLGTLAGGIAHDLNNTLAPITMAIDLLKFKMQDPASLDTLEIARTSARRGADMVRQVLSFARGVAGERLALEPNCLIDEVAKIASDSFPKNIEVMTRMEPKLWQVLGDSTQLHQVLLNLCVNARDAMPHGGQIVICAQNVTLDESYVTMNRDAKAGPHVILEVMDTGLGMPDSILAKIFDPFFTTKGIGQGTGLGLSTSLGIVNSHGGFIRVTSETGKGARFQVYLPAECNPLHAAVMSQAPEPIRGSGEWVLIIDDEEPIRTVTRHALEAFGYRVITASEGAEAIAIYVQRRDEIAVVLTDMMMPVMDGAALIAVLKKINPAVKIISASGFKDEGEKAEGLPGSCRFLAKPYTAETLLRTLAEVLASPSKFTSLAPKLPEAGAGPIGNDFQRPISPGPARLLSSSEENIGGVCSGR